MRIPDATERNVLLYCGSTAAVICLFPGDLVSAVMAAAMTGAFYLVHTRLLQAEEAAAAAATAAAKTATEAETEVKPQDEPKDESKDESEDEREPAEGADPER